MKRSTVEVLARAERFFDSAVLFALAELGVVAALAEGPASTADLAEQVGAEEPSLEALLDAAVALGILEHAGEDHALPRRYAAPQGLVDALTGPDSMMPWLRFMRGVATPFFALGPDLGRARAVHRFAGTVTSDGGGAPRMVAAMRASAAHRAEELAEKLTFEGREHIVSIGCGEGRHTIELLTRHPHMRATLVDAAGPLTEARQHAEDRGVVGRIAFEPADGRTWAPEEPVDVVLLSNVLHMLGPEASPDLLSRVHGMLVPGGRCVVHAQFLDADRAAPRWATLANLILTAATPAGRNHSIQETTGWLTAAGFGPIEELRLSLWNAHGALIAHRT